MKTTPIPNRDEILALLNKSICQVIFTKADGTERTMYCTLLPNYLPERNPIVEDSSVAIVKSPKPRSQELITVWDIDNNNWRAFNLTRVISVRGNIITPWSVSEDPWA